MLIKHSLRTKFMQRALTSNSIDILRPHKPKDKRREHISYDRFRNIMGNVYHISRLTDDLYSFRSIANTYTCYVKFKQ
jgi:hypothetical protein